MELLENEYVTLCVDDRWPRILWYQSPDGRNRVPGEPDAVAPRIYVFRKKDHAELTTDDDVRAEYELRATATEAVYHAKLTCDGLPAAELDIAIRLQGADATIGFENVREYAGYCFLTARFRRVIAAVSSDDDSCMVTCGWQGRLLDPRKCKPAMTDYSWHTTIARQCGAAYRSKFMVTFDVPGYEDLFIQEVRQDSAIAGAKTVASLGTELMHRQRTLVEPGTWMAKPPKNLPPVERLAEPILCAARKEMRLHFIQARKARTLDWTDAAKYFQSLLPRGSRCEPRYDRTLVYKILVTLPLTRALPPRGPLMTLDDAGQIVRKLCNLTDGMRQVCYITSYQKDGRYVPDITIEPALGGKKGLRRLIESGKRWNAVISLHDLLTQVDVEGPLYNPEMTCRDTLGRLWDAGLWDGVQLAQISMPYYLPELKKTVARLVREYGIRTTYHLDTLNTLPYIHDAHPRRPFNATQYNQANWDLIAEFNKYGIDVTSEGLSDAYLGRVGHTWAHVDFSSVAGRVWDGELRVPFANFIYHGAASWNSGTAHDDKAILNGLIQGGGANVTYPIVVFPEFHRSEAEIIDSIYLLQAPYNLLRDRKWTACKQTGAVRRVEYESPAGRASYVEVDDAKLTYRVVVDGELIARDFTTVFQGNKRGTYLAFARTERQLDWPMPKGRPGGRQAGWKNGPVPAVVLTENDPGVHVPARIEKGRLKLTLRAHEPVRVGPI